MRTSTYTERDYAKPLTGCCSNLSADADPHDTLEEWQSACFESNEDYNTTVAHSTISRDEVIRCLNHYHGLCIGDEQIDEFVESHHHTDELLATLPPL